MLPRFNTKDKIILLITELKKKTKPNTHAKKTPNKNKPTNKNQEKNLKHTHQVLALITDKTLRYFGLQDKSLFEASS